MSRLSRGVADTQLGPGKELLHELVPTATLTAVLVNKSNPNPESQTRDLQAAARSLGLQLYVLQASTERDFERAFTTFGQLRIGALMFATDGFFISCRNPCGYAHIHRR
jgi:putative ABC transport system substrate-binding protein